MIGDYRDHAANERTFLAWIRTGIAVIAFGVVIEKFNVFMLTLASTAVAQGQRSELARLFGRVGRYDGLALIFGGVGLVSLATVRFIRTARLLDDAQMHSAKNVRAELILSGWLVLMVISYSIYLAFS
jgi:putative membrane protein